MMMERSELDLLMRTLPKSIPEVDISWFLSHCLPHVAIEDLDQTMEGLQDRIKDGRWMWYPKDPCQMTGRKKTVYRHLGDISHAVLRVGKSVMGGNAEVTARVVCNPRFSGRFNNEAAKYNSGWTQMLLKTTGVGRQWSVVDMVTNFEVSMTESIDDLNSVRTCLYKKLRI